MKLDRRCARDLRLKLKRHGPGLLAGELLCFGAGMLRARNDDPVERIHHYLWSQYGRLHTRHEIVYARIGALHWNSLPLIYAKQKESFDSTNLIYGDAFGELEQLWERRADTAFLEQVARGVAADAPAGRDRGIPAPALEPGSGHEAALALSGPLEEPARHRAGPVAQGRIHPRQYHRGQLAHDGLSPAGARSRNPQPRAASRRQPGLENRPVRL